jgi:hypothetical protein
MKRIKPGYLTKEYITKEKSTKKTFLAWLSECGNDLFDYGGVLSCSGSDGPNITEEKLGKVRFDRPEQIEDYLIEEGYYERQMVMCGEVEYKPPVVHYIDWFNNNIK